MLKWNVAFSENAHNEQKVKNVKNAKKEGFNNAKKSVARR